MNKYFILTFLLFSGCLSSIKEKIKISQQPQSIPFERFDINKDGNITKEEFSASEYGVNIIEPTIWFLAIITCTSIFIYFLNKKKCN
jgi:hypothetical protein